ncbi:hypothetical protein J1N35_026908 [Gossypium stocksii]|uniref:Uncharacterized protein n=1 Tax=Gossypium stocksii TaxID=47602 RepID=A0A9D3ZXI9_9ROSI|nr:hypothetical protein J1N35_026908 [Gossypium stocksii]
MARELIRLDDKHISVEQMRMRGGDPRRTHSIFHVESVLSLWKTCICNWDCRWTETQSLGLFILLIGERYATSFWVLFRKILRRSDRDGLIRDTFPEPNDDSTELEKIPYARWNHSASYVCLPSSLEDIRLLLDQQSEAQRPYEDPAIRAVIPNEYFQNPNAWHVKVPLVNFAIVEMHYSDRVLWQFGF